MMQCPFCKTELEVTAEFAGLTAQCPQCSDYFRVPDLTVCPKCLKTGFEKWEVCPECGCRREVPDEILDPEKLAAEQSRNYTRVQRFTGFVYSYFSGLFSLSSLIFFLFSLVFMLGGIALMGVIFSLGAYFSAFGIGVAAMFVWLHGTAALCTGRVTSLRSAFEELSGLAWDLYLAVSGLPFLLMLLLLCYARYFVRTPSGI